MADLTIQELEQTARAYEDLLVPAVFENWARLVADAARLRAGDRVLDVACGTGVLARTIARQYAATGFICGLDLNPGMLAVARDQAPGIDWRHGDAEALPFDDEAFDFVGCQFGLMLFPNPQTALEEMRRVVRRDGRVMIVVFDSLDSMPAYSAMADLYARVVDPSVGEALRFPFSMGDTEQLTSLMSDAGLNDVAISTQHQTARFSSPRHMVLSDVRGWFPFAGFNLDDRTVDAVVDEARETLGPYRSTDGGVEFRLTAHIVSTEKS